MQPLHSSSQELTVLTLNCCLSVCPPVRFNGAFSRAHRLADAIYSSIAPQSLDVVCFQELVVCHDSILKQMIHHPHHTHVKIESSLFGANVRFLHAGLAICSRWPIVEEDAHVFYGATYHMEALMAKAIQYVKIVTHGGEHVLHVFNTHLQAWTMPRACDIRREQTRQAAQFIARKIGVDFMQTNDKNRHWCVVAGDWNVDDNEHPEIMAEVMQTLRTSMLRPSTVQFSFDPCKNPLVSTDDPQEYATRSKQNGCYEEFLRTGICSCCPRQLVDGIALHDGCSSFLQSYDTNVVPILSRTPFSINVNMSTRRTLDTVSDHFGVVSKMVFLPAFNHASIRFADDVPRVYSYHPPVDAGWILLQIVLFIMFFILLWKLLRWMMERLHRSTKR